jgi:hypothetical protein
MVNVASDASSTASSTWNALHVKLLHIPLRKVQSLFIMHSSPGSVYTTLSDISYRSCSLMSYIYFMTHSLCHIIDK